jgi:hypothetical protein
VLIDERPQGSFTRQLFLGENLDAERLNASYDKGVLTLTIPVSEQAKPRRVKISTEPGQGGLPVPGTDRAAVKRGRAGARRAKAGRRLTLESWKDYAPSEPGTIRGSGRARAGDEFGG